MVTQYTELHFNYQSTFYQSHLSICTVVVSWVAIKIDKLTKIWQANSLQVQQCKLKWENRSNLKCIFMFKTLLSPTNCPEGSQTRCDDLLVHKKKPSRGKVVCSQGWSVESWSEDEILFEKNHPHKKWTSFVSVWKWSALHSLHKTNTRPNGDYRH